MFKAVPVRGAPWQDRKRAWTLRSPHVWLGFPMMFEPALPSMFPSGVIRRNGIVDRRRPYTEGDDERLLQMFAQGRSFRDMAGILRRSEKSVIGRLRRLTALECSAEK